MNKQFNTNWFSLANNVVKLRNDTEKPGLGKCIYELDKFRKNRETYAQGASYLGVVLEELEIFEWNKITGQGIEWKIVNNDSRIKLNTRKGGRRLAPLGTKCIVWLLETFVM